MLNCVDKTILIVDDEPALLVAMEEYFAALGYDVDCADDARRATALLSQAKYEFVIADLRLKGSEDGLDVIKAARNRSPASKLVLLTAYGSPEVEAQAKGLGVNVFLSKPQSLRHLAEILKQLSN